MMLETLTNHFLQISEDYQIKNVSISLVPIQSGDNLDHLYWQLDYLDGTDGDTKTDPIIIDIPAIDTSGIKSQEDLEEYHVNQHMGVTLFDHIHPPIFDEDGWHELIMSRHNIIKKDYYDGDKLDGINIVTIIDYFEDYIDEDDLVEYYRKIYSAKVEIWKYVYRSVIDDLYGDFDEDIDKE